MQGNMPVFAIPMYQIPVSKVSLVDFAHGFLRNKRSLGRRHWMVGVRQMACMTTLEAARCTCPGCARGTVEASLDYDGLECSCCFVPFEQAQRRHEEMVSALRSFVHTRRICSPTCPCISTFGGQSRQIHQRHAEKRTSR